MRAPTAATEHLRRADELFAVSERANAARIDRMFAVLMSAQWVAGILAALWISPLTWNGTRSEVHIHVYAAIFLGGLVAALPVYLALTRPGESLTRHVVAIGQSLTSALFVQLTGGRIETHFHVFGSLAFLASYRDPRVLLTASTVIAIDHLTRAVLWPQSVFGVLAASPWRALEHAGWVVFEDAFLLVAIRRNLKEAKISVGQQARLEASHDLVEEEVRNRTRELVKSRERFRLLSESAPIGIYETDALGQNAHWNARAEEIFGVACEPGSGWGPLIAVVHPEDREAVMTEWERCWLTKSEFSSEYRLVKARGVVRWIHSRAVPSVDETGFFTGFVGTLEDITERKSTEAESTRARDSALETARLKSEFLADMSHEIRTPMNGVLGMTELALESEVSPLVRRYLETAKSSADALLVILNDILDFSKIDAGRLDLESIPFSLEATLRGALDSLSLSCRQKGLELACRVAPDVPAGLIGDPGRLRQVLVNLLGNAFKFTDRGQILLRVEREPEGDTDGEHELLLRFSVVDTGPGIAAEKQGLIFEAFTQADGSITRRHGGTGLGLAISSQLVQLMQGKIWVESAPGTGSSFCFTASFGVASEEQLPSAPPPTAPLEQKRVLVVDDNATNRWILVEAIRAEPTSAALPIILLSSGAESVAEAAAQSLRVCALLTKPVLREDLAQAIRIALGAVSEAPRAARAITPHRSLHILLADDNPVNRGVGVRLMHSRRHTVLAVENGAEALAALEAERFDVVLMDVEMPEMDGFEATILQRERERGTGRRVPIVALTAHAMSGDRERCLAAGMDDYVTKPIRARELFAVFYALTGDASARDAAA